jgi:hypothetical protein
MASNESELMMNGDSSNNGGTTLVLGKNFSRPVFFVLGPPLKEMFTDAAKVSVAKSGQIKVAYVRVAGKHVTCWDSTYALQLDPIPLGIKFSPKTVTVNPGTLIVGDTDSITGGGNMVNESLKDAGVLSTTPA